MSFRPGQKLVCKSTGVTGHFEKLFRATGIGEIVIVRVPDGRLYRAPLSDWAPVIDESQVYGNDCPGGKCEF